MKTLNIEIEQEIIKKLDSLLVKKDNSDTELIKKISKLLDNKFNKNLLNATCKKTQKLFEDFDIETHQLVLTGQIAERIKTKKEIEEILQHTKLDQLTEEDLESVSVLENLVKSGGLYDKITEALKNEKGNNFMLLMSNSYIDRTVYDVKSKLSLLN